MSLKSIVGYKEPWKKILAIDPASHSLAWAVIDCDKNIVETGKIDLSKTKEVTEKFNEITKGVKNIVDRVKYLEENPQLKEKIRAEGKNFILNRLNANTVGKEWVDFIVELTN